MFVTDAGLCGTQWFDVFSALLREADVVVDVFDEVEPNPRTRTAARAAAMARSRGVDGVVGVGGGSVLDAAKAVAMLVRNPGREVAEFAGRERFDARPVPFVAVPTTCGTGSEVTWVSVLTDEVNATKISIKGEAMFPTQALVDADVIATLPPHLIAWTGLDALTHAVEATIGRAANPVSDALAESAIRGLFTYLPRCVADPHTDRLAREAVMRASTIAGLAFGNADVGAVHCLSESLGGMYDVAHGLANAILLAPVLRDHGESVRPRLAALSKLVPDELRQSVRAEDDAGVFVDAVDSLVRMLDIPAFQSLGVPAADYPRLAAAAEANGSNPSNPRPTVMVAADYLEIVRRL